MELTQEFQDLGLVQTPIELNIQDAEICAIKATNRQALIDGVNAYVESDFFTKHPDANYLEVELLGEGIGHPVSSAEYKTEADVPNYSVACSCGNPKHWLIKYGESDNGCS